MISLDRHPLLQRDPGQIGMTLDILGEQLVDGYRQAKRVVVPLSYRNVNAMVVCGMGGSHLGADIMRSVWSNVLPVPMVIVADYGLPAWVGKDTLVIASSYSGSTEETLESLEVARKRRAKIVVMTTGGQLAKRAKKYNLPLFQFVPNANPSGQPRMSGGYTLSTFAVLFWRLGWLKSNQIDPTGWAKAAAAAGRRYGLQSKTTKNPAKQLAKKFHQKIPLLIGAEWTGGNLHTWHNQINENAKTAASWFLLPDLNHHLLEGLRNRRFTRQMHAVMIVDKTYHERTQRRFSLTEKIMKQQGAGVSKFRPHGTTTMTKAIDLLAFGGYVSWYQSALRGIDPAPIPTVDFLKQALGKR